MMRVFAKQRATFAQSIRKPTLALRPTRPQSRSQQLATRTDVKADAQQDVFLREVDDALREDQMLTVMKRHGAVIGAVVFAALVALAGWLWWNSHTEGQAAEQGEKFTVALDQIEAGQIDPGNAAIAPVIAEGGAGYKAAGMMMQAGIALQKGSREQAAKLFGQVAADSDAPQPYRDLARIRQVATTFDSMKPDAVIAQLKPLAVPGSPWFGNAGELVGAAYLKQGRNDLAGPLFAAIAKDPTVPESLRSRSRQLAGLLGVDAIVNVEAEVARVIDANAAANPGAAPASAAAAPAPSGQQ